MLKVVFSALVPALALVILGTDGGVRAHDAHDPRHIAMTALANNMKEIGQGLAAGRITPGMKVLPEEIVEHATALPQLFEKPDGKKNSRAKPEIWTDFAGFLKSNDASIVTASVLSETLNADDVEAGQLAQKRAGDSCGGCHKVYRLPKK